jgi:peptide chain release factor 1
MPLATDAQVQARDADFEWQATRGSGAGGQHRNKTSSAVILRHLPTGLTVRCESERSQHQNRRTAMTLLLGRLREQKLSAQESAQAGARRSQVGSGQRGDKRRTIAVQRGVVHDHPTDRRWSWRDYERGDW